MNQMSHQSNGYSGVDELALFSRIVTGLAVLTGLLYLRVVLGGGLMAAFGDQMAGWLTLTVGLLVLGTIGALLSWRWQRLGAGLMLIAGLGLGGAFYWLQGLGTAVFYGSPFFIASVFCFVCWLRHR